MTSDLDAAQAIRNRKFNRVVLALRVLSIASMVLAVVAAQTGFILLGLALFAASSAVRGRQYYGPYARRA